MKIAVTAGKGGTGKTTVATNLALSLQDDYRVQLLDCDVEEPDAHIFLNPSFSSLEPVMMMRPVIDLENCDYCGKCAESCHYNALGVLPDDVLVYPELCHGCGLCSIVCPQNAISETEHQIGTVEMGTAGGLDFSQGTLTIGDPIAPPIIAQLKTHIRDDAISILDSPPGTACPAVESIHGTDYAILVTEPTPFGLNDLKLTIEVCETFQIPYGVVINRDGIGDDQVRDFCNQEGIPILMTIDNSREIAELYSNGQAFVSAMPEWKDQFKMAFSSILERLNLNGEEEVTSWRKR
ncbi:MAG: ATP-binding protein [Candidatus Acetothermia bacterium]